MGCTTAYERDAVGRITRQILPDGRYILYDYDADGNLIRLAPPGRPGHAFTYTPIGQTETYVPPPVTGGGDTVYAYNFDRELTQITRPDGKQIEFVYNAASGKLATVRTPDGDSVYAYDATTGKLTTLATPDGGALNFSYNGALLSQTAWSGAIAGNVGYAYDNDFRVTEIRVNAADPIAYGYDADSLLTQAGALTLSRDAQNGRLTGTTLGTVSDTYAYNAFGETASYQSSVNANAFAQWAYQRDKLARITQKTETVNGISHSFDYAYDLAGRLIEVKKDGTAQANYAYDANGDRTQVNGQTIADYDDQDRLLNYNGNAYTYTARGELQSKTVNGATTQYDYDVFGNLKHVDLPNGTAIAYVTDGQNRRIGKKVNGILVQGFLYQNQLHPIAELDGNGQVVSRFVYGDKGHVPAYMLKGGRTYRIISDHLGSPRWIVNTADGTMAQQMDYDVWGNVIEDTNPGFQPFGFAGGIYDRDTKLVRFGARDYDAETGRWTAKDPIRFVGGDTNLYGYVEGNPINYIDLSGLARFGFRPLGDGNGSFDADSVPDGNSNVERAHEQLWYDDNPNDNVGFFAGDGSGSGPALCGENGQVRSDNGHSRDQYSFFGPQYYDDALMRQAVDNISPEWNDNTYCLIGANCQSFSDALRQEYERLSTNNVVRSFDVLYKYSVSY